MPIVLLPEYEEQQRMKNLTQKHFYFPPISQKQFLFYPEVYFPDEIYSLYNFNSEECSEQDYLSSISGLPNKEELLSDYHRLVLGGTAIRSILAKGYYAVNSPKWEPVEEGVIIKEGKSEAIFADYLQRCDFFLEHKLRLARHQKVCASFLKTDAKLGKKVLRNVYYYPDIILFDNKGICIDIEIDEHFTAEGYKLIHYIQYRREPGEIIDYENDKPVYESKESFYSPDKARNEDLTKNGWFVIRFAEEQILNNPEKCVSIINCVYLAAKSCNVFKLVQKSLNKRDGFRGFAMPKWRKESRILDLKDNLYL